MFCDGDARSCGCLSHNGFLTRAGYRSFDVAAQRRYVDKPVSVSALPETETDLGYVRDHNSLFDL